MNNLFREVAERKIQEAIKKGELENLPGEGKPVEIEHMLFVPEDQRMAFKIMKNAGMVPQEVELKNDIALLKEQLENTTDEEQREKLTQQLREKNITFGIIMDKHKTKR